MRCRLLTIAKIAELTPPGKKGAGRGNKNSAPRAPFSKHTLSAYRKVFDHVRRIDKYAKAATGAEEEMSVRGFLRFVAADGVIATKTPAGKISFHRKPSLSASGWRKSNGQRHGNASTRARAPTARPVDAGKRNPVESCHRV